MFLPPKPNYPKAIATVITTVVGLIIFNWIKNKESKHGKD